MNNTVIINKGEGLRIQLRWKDEAGVPINLAGKTFQVVDAVPAILETAASFVPVGGDPSAMWMQVTPAGAATLRAGRTNRFRVELGSGDGFPDVTPIIWIDVQ